jgi:hypothetical protein
MVQKGGESDNVLLATDMNFKKHTTRTRKDSDDEQRVFYVGAHKSKGRNYMYYYHKTKYATLGLRYD